MTDIEERRDHWRRVIAEFEASGMTQRAFIKERRLSRSTFQKWLGKYRTVGSRPGVAGELRLLEIQVVDDVVATDVELEVMLAGGHSLWFPAGTDPSYVAALAVAFERSRRC
jgi:hypothetical protein